MYTTAKDLRPGIYSRHLFVLQPDGNFQCACTHFTTCYPKSVRKGFIKDQASRPLRKNSSPERHI